MNLMMNVFTLGYATGNALQQLFRRGNNNIFAYQPPMYYYPYCGQYFIPYEPTQPSYYKPSYNLQPYLSYNYPQFLSVTSAYKPAANSNSESSKVKPSAKTKKSTKITKISTKNKLSELNKLGYSAKKGQKLAQDAAAHATKKSTGWCAKYVRQTIERCGFDNGESGNAYEWGDLLSRNSNFKEVKVSGKDLKKLPAGCIIVYPRGDAGYSSQYGHIEISLGNGKAASDFVNKKIKASDNARVFIPIDA